jgi:hypothetical protein
MSRPAHESGAVIAVDQEVFVSDRVAVLLRYAIAYSTGLAFRVECIRGRPATDRATWLASPKTAELAPADDDTANGDPDQLRVSVSDERGPSNAEPDSAAADANSLIVEFWCDRAPVVELTIAVSWAPHDVEGITRLTEEHVHAARLRTRSFW